MSTIPSTALEIAAAVRSGQLSALEVLNDHLARIDAQDGEILSLIHISEPTRLGMISYAVFCLKSA